jgi:transcriptional regulator with XRE-family HTH domain
MPPRIGPRRPRRLFLAEWRETKGFTQKQVGDRLDVSDMTVSRWERQAGSHKPNTDVLAALSEIYGIEPQDFYRHPDQPSADALLRDQPRDILDQAIRLIGAIRRVS